MIRLKKFISITLIAMMTLAGCGKKETAAINIAGLKGPTTMGIVKLMEDAGSQKTENTYNFEMCTQPDEILPRMLSGELDIALIPANVASVLYNKSQGGITCIDINTLGVLYMVSGNPNISTMQDLDGKTVYMTGKGQTPDYVFSYLLKENGMTDKVTVEYKSEATEVAAVLAQNSEAIGVLPQPFVTAACAQNENLSVCMDLTAEWDKVTNDGSRLITGVTVVRTAFLNDNKEAVNALMSIRRVQSMLIQMSKKQPS